MTSDIPGPSHLAAGAYRFYVSVVGNVQGTFKGGAQGRIPAIRFSYEYVAPQATGTGAGLGARAFQPVTITKEWDASSPQFHAAAMRGEVLSSVLLEFVTISQAGTEIVYYQIKLINAVVCQYRQYISPLPEGGTNLFELEDVSFAFQRIEATNPTAGTTAAGDTAAGRPGGGITTTGHPVVSVPPPGSVLRSPARLGYDITRTEPA